MKRGRGGEERRNKNGEFFLEVVKRILFRSREEMEGRERGGVKEMQKEPMPVLLGSEEGQNTSHYSKENKQYVMCKPMLSDSTWKDN